ncbi:MAG: hypothetical protein O3C63_03305 [Cyanobacteria bacterium]|nr:hypothetical protein [Cyanobacteriota bacterium]
MYVFQDSYGSTKDMANKNAQTGRAYRPPKAAEVNRPSNQCTGNTMAQDVHKLDSLSQNLANNPYSSELYLDYAEAVISGWAKSGKHRILVLGKLNAAIEKMQQKEKLSSDPESRLKIFLAKEEIMKLQGDRSYSLEQEFDKIKADLESSQDTFTHSLTVLALGQQIATDKRVAANDQSKEVQFIKDKLIPIIRSVDKGRESKTITVSKLLADYQKIKAELLIAADMSDEAQEFMEQYIKHQGNSKTAERLRPILAKLKRK